MSRLQLEPTIEAQWRALINEATDRCGGRLDQALEAYLVFLLMRYMHSPNLFTGALALEYLDAAATAGQARDDKLRTVGDKCLLLSGLFPGQAERRRVGLGYFVELGQSAYQQVAEDLHRLPSGDLYRRLASTFVALMDVLHAVRGLNPAHSASALAALERWQETGSQQAWRELRELTDALPVWDPGGHDTRQ